MPTKADLEQYILDNRQICTSLKREVISYFGLKRFSDLPEEKVAEALDQVRWIVDLRRSGQVLQEVIPQFIPGQPNELVRQMELKLRLKFSEHYWATKTPEEALEVIKSDVGDQNLWEYAFKPLDDRAAG